MKHLFLYILLSFTTIIFSQKKKDVEKDISKEITTETKNYIRKGNTLYNQGKYVEAENEYKKAIAVSPNYDKSNYNFGNTQFLQNKMKEAKAQYELVSKTTKNSFIKADSEHNLGNIAMKEEKYDQAIEAYKNALRKNPKDDETRYNLALAQKMLSNQQQKDKDKKDDKKNNKKDKDKDKKDKDNKDKNKDKKDDKGDKDKDKKGDDDKDKKDKQDKKDGDGDKDKKEQQQPKPQPSKLSPDQVKQLLEAMNNEENKTQKKMNARKERGRKVKQDKDW